METTWLILINRRSSKDKMTATKVLRKNYYIDLVTNTWDRALNKRHRDLPEDWINRNVGFLVGSRFLWINPKHLSPTLPISWVCVNTFFLVFEPPRFASAR